MAIETNFPAGRRRKELLEENASKIQNLKKYGREKIKGGKLFSWLDSPINPTKYERGLSFFTTFQEVLPEEAESLSDVIEEALKDRKGEAIGVEFGGIGVKAFSQFTPGFFRQSVGVTLVDHRDDNEKPTYNKSHTVLEEDLLSPETYVKLGQLLQGKKVDFIIERMQAGLEFMPAEPYTISKVLRTWYNFLNEGGIMLVQVPFVFNKLLGEWEKELKNY